VQRFAVWLFTGWARPALFLLTLAIIFELMWTHVSQGWSVCFGMMSLTMFCFLKVLDRLARVTDEEREARRRVTQARRKRNTERWRTLVEAQRARQEQDQNK
jgi:hypothetical protein